ncbi:hypothetical protein OH492_08665 [Vibrio chagasii]|nr:hypothetical protein [Vibrio chagasii]
MKLAETWGPNFPVFGDVHNEKTWQRWLKDVKILMSCKSRIDSANKHKALQAFLTWLGLVNDIRLGPLEALTTGKGKVPNTLYFTSILYLSVIYESACRGNTHGSITVVVWVDGAGLFSFRNLMSFRGIGNTDIQMGVVGFREEINSVEDLQGLKCESRGLQARFLLS